MMQNTGWVFPLTAGPRRETSASSPTRRKPIARDRLPIRNDSHEDQPLMFLPEEKHCDLSSRETTRLRRRKVAIARLAFLAPGDYFVKYSQTGTILLERPLVD